MARTSILEECLTQKAEIKKELDTVETQLKAHNHNDLTWIDVCEQFFTFTQALRRNFTESSIDDKKYLLLLLCQNLDLKDQKIAWSTENRLPRSQNSRWLAMNRKAE